MYAAGGNDRIHVDGFINTIYGDGGGDTALFRGSRSLYTITATSDGSGIVVARNGPSGSDHATTLHGVERIRFSQPSTTVEEES